ncbi:MAG: protein phosphatase CheZ [Thiogranum sp.]
MEAATTVDNTGLLDQARELVRELEAGNMPAAEGLIDQLSQVREQALFQELGKMTRQLHDSLSDFALDARVQSLAESDIPDAKARLNHVIEMTETSANQTLSAVEDTLPIAARLQQVADTLHEQWGRFRNKDMGVEEFRGMSREIDEFLSVTRDNADQIHSNLSDVMMAQEFQDLTGQILRRVITLVQEVEDNLVELIRLSGGREAEDESAPAAAPKAPAKENVLQGVGPQVPGTGDDGGAVSGQDEVDDLLSSLGF